MASINPISTQKICGQCAKPKPEIQMGKWGSCGKCRSVYYCSRECQTAAWPLHKKICSKISTTKIITETLHEKVERAVQDPHLKGSLEKKINESAQRHLAEKDVTLPTIALLEKLERLIENTPSDVMKSEKEELVEMRRRLEKKGDKNINKEEERADMAQLFQIEMKLFSWILPKMDT